MRPSFLLFSLLRPALVALAVCFSPARASAASDEGFAQALVDLRREREVSDVLGVNLEQEEAMLATFYGRFAIEDLGPAEMAELVRLSAFRIGEVAEAKVRIVAGRANVLAATPDEQGALAASVRVLVGRAAGIKGEDFAAAIETAITHPAYVSLLQGEFGDLALSVACRAGMRSEKYRAFVVSLAGRLDATKSPAAASSVREYWGKIEQAIPPGEERQRLRRQLAAYLTAVLTEADGALTAKRRSVIEATLVQLESAAARGETLIGKAAPPLEFIWSSEGSPKSWEELRGKTVVLEFWATWCGQCIASFPKMARLAERYRGTDVVVLGVTSLQGAVFGLGKSIDCRDNPQKEMQVMPEFMQAKGITWPVVLSREPAINPAYGIPGLPSIVVIGPDGTVRHQVAGLTEEAALIEQIDAARE